MTLQESGDSTAAVSLAGLFSGIFNPAQCPTGIAELAEIACRGGWPAEVKENSESSQIVVREYLETIYEQSIPRLGGNPEIGRRLCASLARNLGQSATNATLARDVYALSAEAMPSDADERAVSEHVGLFSRM